MPRLLLAICLVVVAVQLARGAHVGRKEEHAKHTPVSRREAGALARLLNLRQHGGDDKARYWSSWDWNWSSWDWSSWGWNWSSWNWNWSSWDWSSWGWNWSSWDWNWSSWDVNWSSLNWSSWNWSSWDWNWSSWDWNWSSWDWNWSSWDWSWPYSESDYSSSEDDSESLESNESPDSGSNESPNTPGTCGRKDPTSNGNGIQGIMRNMLGRIVGGVESDQGEWPWMVAIQDPSGFQYCGATLVSTSCVITAAHCLVDESGSTENPSDVKCLLGEHNFNAIEGFEHDSATTSVIPHEKYNSKKIKNDIAVLILEEEPTISSHIGPACLPDENFDIYDKDLVCHISGWGLTTEAGSSSNHLRHVEVEILSYADCKDAYGNDLKDGMFCAGSTGVDSCQGDSGGPLVCREKDGDTYTLVGVVSWGIGCGTSHPGVYTDVRQYLDWIDSACDSGRK